MKNNIYSKTYLKNIINYIYIRRNLTKGVDYFTCGKELKILFSIIFVLGRILLVVIRKLQHDEGFNRGVAIVKKT